MSEVRGSILALGNFFFFFFGPFVFGSFVFVLFLTDLKYTGRLITDSFSHFISKVQ